MSMWMMLRSAAARGRTSIGSGRNFCSSSGGGSDNGNLYTMSARKRAFYYFLGRGSAFATGYFFFGYGVLGPPIEIWEKRQLESMEADEELEMLLEVVERRSKSCVEGRHSVLKSIALPIPAEAREVRLILSETSE